jgi:hypothetical protein
MATPDDVLPALRWQMNPHLAVAYSSQSEGDVFEVDEDGELQLPRAERCSGCHGTSVRVRKRGRRIVDRVRYGQRTRLRSPAPARCPAEG